jgi:hypothetical protein
MSREQAPAEVVSTFGAGDPSRHADRVATRALEREHELSTGRAPGWWTEPVAAIRTRHDRPCDPRPDVANEQTGRAMHVDTRRERQSHRVTIRTWHHAAGNRLGAGQREQWFEDPLSWREGAHGIATRVRDEFRALRVKPADSALRAARERQEQPPAIRSGGSRQPIASC